MSSPYRRSIAAPSFLTDLGVRKFEDPAVFFALNLERADLHAKYSKKSTHNLLLNSNIHDLAKRLDSLILLTGDYDTGYLMVRGRYNEVLESRNYKLLIYSAVLLAALKNKNSIPLFEKAAEATNEPTNVFMAHHRLAATVIKRLNALDQGIHILDTLDTIMEQEMFARTITSGDLQSLKSVTANLRALAFLKKGDISRTKEEMEKSLSLATLEGLLSVNTNHAARYMAQEKINLAQVYIARQNLNVALEILTENVKFCQRNSIDYLSEALSTCAYGLFLAERFKDAIDTSRKAVQRMKNEASPVRLKATRNILIASLASSGDSESAKEELKAQETDPLGIAC